MITDETVAVSLAALDSSFGQGLRLLDEVVGADSALSRRDKFVISAGITAFGDPPMYPSAAERAVDGGVTIGELRALALALYLSRGHAPARVVLDALPATLGATDPDPDHQPDRPPGPIATADIIAEFAAVFGEVPDRVRLLEQHCRPALEAYHRMRIVVLRGGGLEPRLAELVLFAVNAADRRADYAAVHARGARRAGATEAQLVEAGVCSIPVGGVAAWLAAAEAITATAEDG